MRKRWEQCKTTLMKQILYTISILIIGFSCSRSNKEIPSNQIDSTIKESIEIPFQYLITNGKIGNISIGENIDSAIIRLKSDFIIEKDSLPTCEGCDEYTTLFIVLENNASTVLFGIEPGWDEINKNKIIRITTRSNKFTTDKGIKVGMTVKEIRENYEINFIDAGGETGLHIILKDFEGSFGIELPNSEDWWDYDKETIPDSLRIDEIIVT
jgi:hypothetical protein